MVPEAGVCFDRGMTWNIIFRGRYRRFVTPYVLRSIAVPLKARRYGETSKSDGTRLCELWEQTNVRKLHEARSLMARTSTERLGGEYDLEPRGSALFLYTESTQPFRASTNVVLYWF